MYVHNTPVSPSGEDRRVQFEETQSPLPAGRPRSDARGPDEERKEAR